MLGLLLLLLLLLLLASVIIVQHKNVLLKFLSTVLLECAHEQVKVGVRIRDAYEFLSVVAGGHGGEALLEIDRLLLLKLLLFAFLLFASVYCPLCGIRYLGIPGQQRLIRLLRHR